MVVDLDAERLGHLHDLPRHLDVGARRRGIAGGMIVDQDHGGADELQRALHHLARIDRGMVHRALLLHLVGDQTGFACRGRECGTARARRRPWRRGSSRSPRSSGRAQGGRRSPSEHGARGGVDDLQFHGNGFAHAPSPPSDAPGWRSGLRRSCRSAQKGLRERLRVAPGNGAEQNHLKQFIIGERVGAGFAEALRSRSR